MKTHTQILAQGWGGSGGKEYDDSTDVIPGKLRRITKGKEYFIGVLKDGQVAWGIQIRDGRMLEAIRWPLTGKRKEGRGSLGVRQALGPQVDLWCGLKPARFPRGHAEKSWP